MTSKNEMSQKSDTRGDKDPDVDTKETKQESKSTGYAGAKYSANKKHEKKSGVLSRMLITILLAFTVLVVYAYFYMPDKFNEYVYFNDSSESNNGQAVSNDADNSGLIPATPAENYAMNNQAQQADWAAQQRANFEKRRAEFQNRHAENYAQQRQAQQRQPMAQTEVPQWVKDRQADMEKQRAQYMKNMAEQQARWEESMKRNQMQMNSYQQPATNAQQPAMRYQQNQQPAMQYQQYNPANQPPPQYYNRPPVYNNAPYQAPYGWQGNGYR